MVDWNKPDTISTLDLIEYISWKGQGDEETEEAGKRAFGIFYGRFSKDLSQKCEILCNRHGYDSSDALELVEKTFSKFISLNKFNISKCKTQDVDLCVKFYLYKIAYYALIDIFREKKGLRKSKNLDEGELIFEVEQIETFNNQMGSKSDLAKRLALVSEAVSRLNNNQKLIYLTYMNAGIGEKEMPPRPLAKKIRDATGLTQSSVRSELNRARKIVNVVIDIYAQKK